MKKVYGLDKFLDRVAAPITTLKFYLVAAGNSLMDLNDKSETELRQMALNYITLDLKDVPTLFELNPDIGKKLLILLDLTQEEFFEKIGYTQETKSEATPKSERSEKEEYLFHTEKIYGKAVIEFLNSKQPNKERVLQFINRIKNLKHIYTDYVVQTSGFFRSERYAEVYELFKSIPFVAPYDSENSNLSETDYYDFMVNRLEDSFSNEEEDVKVV